MATTYIQFTGRLKATSQEGILAEAQQVAVSSTDSTNIKTYIDNQIKSVQSNISSVAGSVYRPKGSLTVANFKALTSAAVGDVYNITEQFTLSGRTYPAYTNVACVKAFSASVTPDDTYWDALGGTVDLSPYAKTTDVNSKVDTLTKSISDNVSALETKISTAQSTANTANTTASENKTSISGLTTRVSTLEGSDHVNKINSVKVDGTALTIDSSKAVNIDLSGKVDKVAGKGLSTNDFTAAYKSKLDGIASGANAYTLPSATATALGGVKVGAVDDATISDYQGASTTLRNGKLMCDLVTDSKNGALSKTDYAAFKKTGTDLAALDKRVETAEDDINQLFSDKADASELNKRIESGVTVGGIADQNAIYCSNKKLTLGEGVAKISGNVTIGTDVYLTTGFNALGVNATINIGTDGVVDFGTNVQIGTKGSVSIGCYNENLYIGGAYAVSIGGGGKVAIGGSGEVEIPGHVTIGTRGVIIGTDGSVSISGNTIIDKNVTIGENAFIGTNSNLGEHTWINDYVTILDNVTIGTDQDENSKVIIGTDGSVLIGGNTSIGKSVEIGTNGVVKISGNTSLANSNGVLMYGADSANIAVAKQTDLNSLASRVTVIENLLKLA